MLALVEWCAGMQEAGCRRTPALIEEVRSLVAPIIRKLVLGNSQAHRQLTLLHRLASRWTKLVVAGSLGLEHTQWIDERLWHEGGLHQFSAWPPQDSSHQKDRRQTVSRTDVWLHETVAAWVREFFRKRRFKKAETLEQNFVLFKELLGECQRHINQDYEVGDLCRGFPQRLRDVAAKGDRLKS